MSQRGGILYFNIEPFILESLHGFSFLSDGPTQLAQSKLKKVESKLL
jgi:hypothetical protein